MPPPSGQVVVSVDASSAAVTSPPTTTSVGSPVDHAPEGLPVTGLLGGTVLVLLALLLVCLGLAMKRVATGALSPKDL